MNSCNLDVHYRPFISRCAYCDLNYLVISKLENFTEDRKFIGQILGLQLEKLEAHKSSGGNTKEVSKDYFRMLDNNTVDKLYKIYGVDLEMFDYNFDQYSLINIQ